MCALRVGNPFRRWALSTFEGTRRIVASRLCVAVADLAAHCWSFEVLAAQNSAPCAVASVLINNPTILLANLMQLPYGSW
jgi:hypothetical protein